MKNSTTKLIRIQLAKNRLSPVVKATQIWSFSKWLLVALFVFLMPAICGAEDIYISQTASGGDTGVDSANAHSVAWLNTAGNWGDGADKISAGDTAHLCGTFTGTAGNTMITIPGNGASENYVTILFEADAKLTAPYWGVTGAIALGNHSYIEIDGGTNGVIDATDNGTELTYDQESFGITSNGASNIKIHDLIIENMYVHTFGSEDKGTYYAVAIWGISSGYFGSNIEVYNMTVHDCGTFFAIGGMTSSVSNWKIHDNEVYNFLDGMFINTYSNYTIDGLEIYNNHLYDCSMGGAAPPYHLHTDGMQLAAYPNGNYTNLKIYNNEFSGIGWEFPDGQKTTTGFIFLDGHGGTSFSGVQIYNNLFHPSCSPQALTPSGGFIHMQNPNASGNIHIYNNTFVGCWNEGDGGNGIAARGIEGNATGIIIKNNIFKNMSMICYATGTPVSESTNNLYIGSRSDVVYYNSAYRSWSYWTDTLGFGANSLYNTDPSLDANYKPDASDDPVVGAGTNLSGTFSTDKDGESRLQSAAWTLGCYELTQRPRSPNNFRTLP
ncbi:MAG: hypothetical protein JW787_13075 [Sedimentisphaerales bacterium]|nr:hypothetical protein [Sedimentisphaerales bacterium]